MRMRWPTSSRLYVRSQTDHTGAIRPHRLDRRRSTGIPTDVTLAPPPSPELTNIGADSVIFHW
jgi:hypothetical protein